MTTPTPKATAQPTLPTDFQVKSFVFRMRSNGGNLECFNITACLASNMRVKNDWNFKKHVESALKRLVRNKELRRTKFLPGRPFYTIS